MLLLIIFFITVIIILLFVIFILFFYKTCKIKNSYKIKYSNIEGLIKGTVALVGNGPISNKDRDEINENDIVIRFNDLKNFRNNERCDIHVIRYDYGFYNIKSRPDNSIIWPVSPSNELVFTSEHLVGLDGIYPLLLYSHKSVSDLSPTATLFYGSDCGKKCIHSTTLEGPSTGAIVIDALEKCSTVDKINIYGMNWSGSKFHIDFKNPGIIGDYCSKCIIHPTSNKNYK